MKMPSPTLIGFRRNGAPIYLVQGGAPTPLEVMKARVDELHDRRGQIIDKAAAEQRGMLASEKREFDQLAVQRAEAEARVGELKEQEDRMAIAGAARVAAGETGAQYAGLQGGYHIGGGEPYHRGPDSPSFFKDRLHARSGDMNAGDRLRRNNEVRALGNTGGTGGSGGEFAPPAYLLEDWVRLARPGRVTADLFYKQDLPANVSSVQIPKISTGTTTATQSTQNTALSQTDLTTAFLSSGIVTIGGKQVVAQQLVDQSGIPFDKVVMEDIAADYAKQIGVQVLIGTGAVGQLKGFLTPASTNVVTWTQATPTAAGFYGQLARLQGQIAATRLAPADVIVMAPRRWAWLASYTDSTGRPLVVPTAGGFNSMATPDGAYASAGHVGTLLGLDVVVDPNIPINLGAGLNQDVVLMFKRDDIWFWEADLRADIQTAPYADSLGLLFRCWNYSAMIPDRYLASLGQLQGTGLTTPTFAS